MFRKRKKYYDADWRLVGTWWNILFIVSQFYLNLWQLFQAIRLFSMIYFNCSNIFLIAFLISKISSKSISLPFCKLCSTIRIPRFTIDIQHIWYPTSWPYSLWRYRSVDPKNYKTLSLKSKLLTYRRQTFSSKIEKAV